MALQKDRKKRMDNKSGVTGVTFDRNKGLWIGFITRDGHKLTDSFSSKSSAILIYAPYH